MGLFGGSSKSKTTTNNITEYDVSTITETSIGDVGLTGRDAVELAAVLSRGITFASASVMSRSMDSRGRAVSDFLADNAQFLILGAAAVSLVFVLKR